MAGFVQVSIEVVYVKNLAGLSNSVSLFCKPFSGIIFHNLFAFWLIERLVGPTEDEVGGHAGEDEDGPFDEQLVEEVSSNFVETAQPEQIVG